MESIRPLRQRTPGAAVRERKRRFPIWDVLRPKGESARVAASMAEAAPSV